MMRLTVIFLGLLMLCSGASAATPGGVVFVAEPDSTIVVGDSFVLDIRGKEFPEPIDGGGLNILFDGSMLHLTSIEPASVWMDFFDQGTLSDPPGSIENLYFNSLSMAGVGGDFSIVRLTFEAFASGVATISLAGDDVFVFGRLGEELLPQFTGHAVSIASVPEPATALALVVGSCLIVGLRFISATQSSQRG
jgi:hypothetical protein